MSATLNPPARTLDQRLVALERANYVRTRRAQLKRDLKAGSASVCELVAAPPDWADTARVADMLLAVPKFGRTKVKRLLVHCQVSPHKTLAGLNPRQRLDLIATLRHRGLS